MTANPLGLIIIGVGLLIAGLVLLVTKFDKVKEGILAVGAVIKKVVMGSQFGLFIKGAQLGFKGIKALGSALGIGGGPDETPREDPQIVSPEERMVRRIETSSSISKTELSIRDHTGRAELTGEPGTGTQFKLARSGGFN